MNQKNDSILEYEKSAVAEDLLEQKDPSKQTEESPTTRKYHTKHMKMFPELYRSDVSIHPSYTGLKKLPYYVVCRHRTQRLRRQISRQLNREIAHFAMVQMFALDGVRIDRIFSVGLSPRLMKVPDPLTKKERFRLNNLLREP